MKELKIFAILVVFTGIVYWGVEPYAHSQMHEHTSEVNFDFKAGDIAQAEVELKKANESGKKDDIDFATKKLEDTKKLWANVDKIASLKIDVEAGKADFEANCASCHRVEFDELVAADDGISAQGIIYPDLSTAGAIYDSKFLMAISLNPALAMKNNKKYNDENPHPMMTAFLEDDGSISDENAQSVANIVGYLNSIGKAALEAKKAKIANEINASKLSDSEKVAKINFENKKVIFEEACGRCHDVKYDGFIAKVNGGDLKDYMGSTPPDLSIIIRAKGDEYLHKFINDTQKQLPGTAMPRVGLNEQAQNDVVAYLTSVGDSKKAEREDLGYKIMAYFALLAILAYAWKNAIWKELH